MLKGKSGYFYLWTNFVANSIISFFWFRVNWHMKPKVPLWKANIGGGALFRSFNYLAVYRIVPSPPILTR